MSTEQEYLPRPPKSRQLNGNTLNSKKLKKLREGPRTHKEMDVSINGYGFLRNSVFKLSKPSHTSSGGDGVKYGRWTCVFYLYGDERRAVRKAIEENTGFVAQAFENRTNNAFAQNWPDQLYQILCEEWECYRKLGDIDG